MSIEEIRGYLSRHNRTIEDVAQNLCDEIDRCSRVIAAALEGGNKILVMGNGGSAADAQHLAAEFVGRFLRERKALPAIALTTDTSILTAVGNDYGFDEVFRRQVEALANPGDILIGLSTSGNSGNILHALDCGKKRGCITIGFSGGDGGAMADMVDYSLNVSSRETPHIQEAHITIVHILCDQVEKTMTLP